MHVSLHKAQCSAFDMACETFSTLGVTRHEAQQWCLAHAFELVELSPQELPDEDGGFYRQCK